MKAINYFLAILLIQIVTFSSCNKEVNFPVYVDAALNELVIMHERDIAEYSLSTGEILEIEITDINDSRCPQDVVCVWEGMVEVVFDISGVDYIVQLCLGNINGCDATYQFILDQNTYIIELIGVTPYPSTQNTGQETQVEFKVSLV